MSTVLANRVVTFEAGKTQERQGRGREEKHCHPPSTGQGPRGERLRMRGGSVYCPFVALQSHSQALGSRLVEARDPSYRIANRRGRKGGKAVGPRWMRM